MREKERLRMTKKAVMRRNSPRRHRGRKVLSDSVFWSLRSLRLCGEFLALLLFLLSPFSLDAASASRGLWVGEVVLNNVNEVTSAVNAQNVMVSPNPTNTTPTASAAHLRLILHVDAGGQVRLLNSVAVINKSSNSEPNIALLTDPTLYPNFPGVAKRFSAAAFDFGDLASYVVTTNLAGKIATAAIASTSSNGIYSACTAAVYQVVASAPSVGGFVSSNYLTLVTGAAFKQAGLNAALAATKAAFVLAQGAISTQEQIRNTASSAALLSLSSTITEVDKFTPNDLPLDAAGRLEPGGVLTGTIYLGGGHPTNPFRHRMHPDHDKGYPIVRNLRLEVNTVGGTNQFLAGGYGVDRLTGIYREEIHGLHKPLGPEQNIGLRTWGAFTLNRLSLVDTLNQ